MCTLCCIYVLWVCIEKNEIKNLQTAKATQHRDIQTKILKEKSNIFARYFNENNFCIENLIILSDLKLADVTLAFKKKSKTSEDNYRPISILPDISKIFERCFYNQIHTFFNEVLSKYRCGFSKGLNTRHCLVSMIEKWQSFRCPYNRPLWSFWLFRSWTINRKVYVYDFDLKSARLIQQHLLNRKQRVKLDNAYSLRK